MAAQWFCKIAGKEHGPLSAQQLMQLARAHRLKPTDPVRKDKSAWVAANKVQGLFPKADAVASATTGPSGEATANWTKPAEAEAKASEESDQGDGFSVLDGGSDDSPKEADMAADIYDGLFEVAHTLESYFPAGTELNFQYIVTTTATPCFRCLYSWNKAATCFHTMAVLSSGLVFLIIFTMRRLSATVRVLQETDNVALACVLASTDPM